MYSPPTPSPYTVLEREKNTIAKKYETKIEDYTNKVSSLEERLAEWETQAGSLEDKARKTAEEWEAKLAEEKVRVRDVQFDLDKAQTKMKVMENELVEARDSCSKIDEYEQVLGKLMERNEELEADAKNATDEVDQAHRQVELLDRRRTVKVKDLEDKVEEQRIMIEQQQETLDESVKTILKLYSLNNERGDDLSVLSEDKLQDMARQFVPKFRSSLPPIRDVEQPSPRGGESTALTLTTTGGYSRSSSRPSTTARRSSVAASSRGRDRELNDEVENLMQEQSRARSRGRGCLGPTNESESLMDRTRETQIRSRSRGRHSQVDTDMNRAARADRFKSRGRGDRTESIRQLTERARTPSGRRPSENRRDYDPSAPVSDSRALVLVTPKEDNALGGEYDIPPPQMRRQSSRRDSTRDRGRDMHHNNEIVPYSPSRQQQQQPYERQRSRSRGRQHHHRNSQSNRQHAHPQQHHHRQPQSGGYRDRPDRDRRDKDYPKQDSRRYRDHRIRDDRDRDRDQYDTRNRGDRDQYDRNRDQRNREYRRGSSGQERRSRSGGGYGHPSPSEEAYSSSQHHRTSSTRDPSLAGDMIISEDGGGEIPWSSGSNRQHSGGRLPSSRRRDDRWDP